MTARKWLLSTAAAAGVFLAVGGARAAQTAEVLQPDGNWAVSKIAAAQGDGGSGYCAMARRYGQEIILTIARNAGGETSVAVDFQKDKLDKSHSYGVTLNPGFGQQRSYDVTPISGKAVVLRLGQDAKFRDALARSGSLSIDVGGDAYEFSMPDIANGESQIAGCLASLAEPAAGNEAPRASEPEQKSQPQPIAEAQPVSSPAATGGDSREADALREENTRLRNALERERRDFENRFQQADTSSMAAELNEKIRLLEDENGKLKGQISSVPVPVAPAPAAQVCPAADGAETAAMAKELSSLRDENAKLKQDSGASQSAAQELAALRGDNTKLRSEVEELNIKLAELDGKAAEAAASARNEKAGVDAQSAATIGRLQGRVDVLEAENAGLKESLRAAQEKAAATASAQPQDNGGGAITLSQLRSVEEQLKNAEAERDSLRAQMERLRAGKEETVIGSIAGNNWDLEQATRRFNEAEREIRRLGAQIEQQRSQCAAEKKEIEYQLFDPAIASQEQIAKLTELEQELAQAKAQNANGDTGYIQQISDLKKQVADKEAELAAMRGSVAAQNVNAPGSYTAAELPAPRIQAQAMPVLKESSASESAVMAKIAPAAGTPKDVVSSERATAATMVSSPAAQSSAPVSSPGLSSEKDIAALLSAAKVDPSGKVKKEHGAADGGYDAYSWEENGGLYGSAEVRAAGGDSFDDLVSRYLSRTQGRCKGDFAAVPAPFDASSPVRSVEIACVGGNESASAAVAFFMKGGQFIAIAHEAPVESMDMAMDARDKIIASVTRGGA